MHLLDDGVTEIPCDDYIASFQNKETAKKEPEPKCMMLLDDGFTQIPCEEYFEKEKKESYENMAKSDSNELTADETLDAMKEAKMIVHTYGYDKNAFEVKRRLQGVAQRLHTSIETEEVSFIPVDVKPSQV